MKNFKDLVSEVAQPKAPEEKRFKDQHTIEVIPHPVAPDHVFSGEEQNIGAAGVAGTNIGVAPPGVTIPQPDAADPDAADPRGKTQIPSEAEQTQALEGNAPTEPEAAPTAMDPAADPAMEPTVDGEMDMEVPAEDDFGGADAAAKAKADAPLQDPTGGVGGADAAKAAAADATAAVKAPLQDPTGGVGGADAAAKAKADAGAGAGPGSYDVDGYYGFNKASRWRSC